MAFRMAGRQAKGRLQKTKGREWRGRRGSNLNVRTAGTGNQRHVFDSTYAEFGTQATRGKYFSQHVCAMLAQASESLRGCGARAYFFKSACQFNTTVYGCGLASVAGTRKRLPSKLAP
jgi:hypothetical protein